MKRRLREVNGRGILLAAPAANFSQPSLKVDLGAYGEEDSLRKVCQAGGVSRNSVCIRFYRIVFSQ